MNAVTIHRHAVPSLDEGLSPLQRDLLACSAPVRIAQAPTGAGKSFAFRQAVLQRQRVLFIVPTKRLAQNLANDMREAFRQAGLSDMQIERRLAVWSRDQTDALKHQDKTVNVTAVRMNQAQQLAPFGQGDMIIAVPEVVSYLAADDRRNLMIGHSRFGLLDLLNFDHVVFDEFHTIEPRGFGLAAVFAYLAARLRPRFPLRVSLLSATPLDLRPALERFGVPAESIAELSEEIQETGFDASRCRVVHGDVRLHFEQQDRLVDTVRTYLPEVRRQLADWETRRRQVILIYDALADLRRQRPELEALLAQAAISPEHCLLINSIDDSADEYLPPGRFASGRKLDPLDFRVLIATASVELGVTFRADLLLMEPGFSPLNFLQRYGRAARGNHEGQVVVRTDARMRDKRPWLRSLLTWAEQHQGQTLSIRDLTQVLTARTRKVFEQPVVSVESAEHDPRQRDYFGQMPTQAVYTAGLYWQALERHPAFKATYQGEHLKALRPPSAKTIWALLQQVGALKDFPIPDVGEAAERWCRAFQEEALRLRDIGRTVEVMEETSGWRLRVQEHWLALHTHILERFPLQIDERGELKVVVPGELDDFQRLQKQYEIKTVSVLFPHTLAKIPLRDDYQLVKRWCDALRDSGVCYAWEDVEADFPEALRAAESLTRITGLVVVDRQQIETDSAACVW